MARSFNGSSDVLRHSADIVGSFPFTMACWFDSNNVTANQNLMGVFDQGAPDHFIRMFAGGANAGDPLSVQINSGSGATTDTEAVGYTANTLHHACGTVSSSAIETFLNGVSDGSTSHTEIWPTGLNATTLGVLDRSSITQYFNGEIAEAGIWSVILTQSEIDSLAAGVSPSQIRPESLIAYWPIIGRTSPEIDPVGKYELTVAGATQAAHPRIIQPNAQIIQFPSVISGATYNQSIAGSITPSGIISKKVAKILLGSALLTGLIIKKVSKVFSGSTAPSSTLVASTGLSQAISGTISMSGAISRKIGKGLIGSITILGDITKKISKFLIGSMTPSGNISKKTSRLLIASTTLVGVATVAFTTTETTIGSIAMSGIVAGIKGIAQLGRSFLMLLGVG